ncbi:hypothetical protein GCM10023231_02790 [Olivibacter ginsenosidimutans]|uniref:Tetratricopeptide repeat protein n=1 Tax=Olivibacter ginsenosidimutans TaxID=1176537 RepID=A0ABP9AE19_9SPHI
MTLFFGIPLGYAQSNIKEGNNNFARYTKSGDIKDLLEARKFADLAYKEKRDSSSYNNTLLKGLVYSSLAVADSNRTQKYDKDPIDEAEFMLSRLNDKQLNFENEAQINYLKKRLATAYLIKANRALINNNYEEAYNMFSKVNLYNTEANVNHNLALLSERLGKKDEAIHLYNDFIKDKSSAKPGYILTLSRLYLEEGDNNAAQNVLIKGRTFFPTNKDILFALLNLYASNGAYDAVVALADEAIAFEPESVSLNYLLGFAYEVTGKREQAERYYKKTLSLDPDDYNSNYELGLLYLKDFIKDTSDLEKQYEAQQYLLKANEIDPNAVNALKSLAVLFDKSGNEVQLERVNNQLNQINIQ